MVRYWLDHIFDDGDSFIVMLYRTADISLPHRVKNSNVGGTKKTHTDHRFCFTRSLRRTCCIVQVRSETRTQCVQRTHFWCFEHKLYCTFLHLCGAFFIHVKSAAINFFHFFLCSDSVLRNDSTRLIQPEVIFRTDGNGQAPGINSIGNGAPMDRKGAVAIGQSVFYTEYPPQDYGVSGRWTLFVYRIYIIRWIDMELTIWSHRLNFRPFRFYFLLPI